MQMKDDMAWAYDRNGIYEKWSVSRFILNVELIKFADIIEANIKKVNIIEATYSYEDGNEILRLQFAWVEL